MTEKDLMRGLNEIDDDLIEEAAGFPERKRVPRSRWRFPAAAAAVLVLGVGLYAGLGGLPGGKQGWMPPAKKQAAETAQERSQGAEDAPVEKAAETAQMAENALVETAPAADDALAENAQMTEEVQAEDAPEAITQAAEDVPAERITAETVSAEGASPDAGEKKTVGIASDRTLGEDLQAAKDYGEIYEKLDSWRNELAVEEMEKDVQLELAPLEDEVEVPLAAANDASGTWNAVPAAGAAETTATAKTGEADYSSTNLMTQGVDESDIAKTDGRYLYIVCGNQVRIVDIREGAPGKESRISLPAEAAMDQVEELFVDDDRLIVIGSHLRVEQDIPTLEEERIAPRMPDGMETVAAVFTLGEEQEPAYAGALIQDGGYYTSRKVGHTLYLFSRKDLYFPGLSREEALTDEGLTEWIPRVNGLPVAADCIYLAEQSSTGLLISSVDVEAPEQVLDAKFLFTNYGEEIYVGSDAIYLYYEKWTEAGGDYTKILKLTYREGSLEAGAAGSVRGTLCDRFAINEYNGRLRVLTTDFGAPEENNTLYLLDEELRETGRIDGIAPGESIYAARYFGDLAYFVTYRDTDPLFAADLSDPAAPRILGELSITGFSEYLHRWDETHLLGIGYETDPETGNFLGVKMTMFDITDPAHVQVEHSKVLRDDRGSSAIDWNYKGILADPGKNLIGFMTYRDAEEGYRPCYSVFSYDPEEGFQTKLRSVRKEYEDLSEECRGLYAGDWFYVTDGAHLLAFSMEEGDEGWQPWEASGAEKEDK